MKKLVKANEFQGGYFVEELPGGEEILHKNTLVATGASWFLRDIFRKETALLPNTYYLGLTNAAYTFDQATLLAALAVGEPVGNGYARMPLVRGTADWTVQEVNGVMQALSVTCAFTASANWDKTWTRAFICNAAAGTAGEVISVSGPAPAARTVLSGQGPSIKYEYYLRG